MGPEWEEDEEDDEEDDEGEGGWGDEPPALVSAGVSTTPAPASAEAAVEVVSGLLGFVRAISVAKRGENNCYDDERSAASGDEMSGE